MVSKDNATIQEKIKKLLSVTEENGATEQEAIAAALKAQKLMAKLDKPLTNNKDNSSDSADDPIVRVATPKQRNWQLGLAWVIAKNFRCFHYQDRRWDEQKGRNVSHIVFYGHPQDAEAARIVFERLCAAAKRLGNAYARNRRKELVARTGGKVSQSSIFNTWIDAFIEGVRSELERQSQELMIAIPRDVQRSYRRFSAGFKTVRRAPVRRVDDCTTRNAGRNAGRDSVRAGRVGAAGSTTARVARSHRLPA